MGVDIPTQAALFGQGVLLGALLGLVYDVMRAARRATGCRWLAFLLDLAFWVGTTWTLFLFALVRGDGRIQVFYLVALALGGGGYLLTLSRLTMPVFLGMFRLLQAHIIHHRHQMEVNGRDGILLSLQGKGGFHNADAFSIFPLQIGLVGLDI